MENVKMEWRCLINVIPIPNSIIMRGEIDISPISERFLLLRTVIYAGIAERNGGEFIIANLDKYNYPPDKEGKIVLQFQMTFPDRKNLDKFMQEISLLK